MNMSLLYRAVHCKLANSDRSDTIPNNAYMAAKIRESEITTYDYTFVFLHSYIINQIHTIILSYIWWTGIIEIKSGIKESNQDSQRFQIMSMEILNGGPLV